MVVVVSVVTNQLTYFKVAWMTFISGAEGFISSSWLLTRLFVFAVIPHFLN